MARAGSSDAQMTDAVLLVWRLLRCCARLNLGPLRLALPYRPPLGPWVRQEPQVLPAGFTACISTRPAFDFFTVLPSC